MGELSSCVIDFSFRSLAKMSYKYQTLSDVQFAFNVSICLRLSLFLSLSHTYTVHLSFLGLY